MLILFILVILNYHFQLQNIINKQIKIQVMASSKFDQRMFKNTNEMYYFQFVPKLLSVKSSILAKNLKAANTQFRLLIKRGDKLCDQMKESIAVKTNNGKAAFQKVQLNFTLEQYNPNRNIQYILYLQKSQENQQKQAAKHTILSSSYIVQFKDSKKRSFNQTVNLGNDYTLTFDMFLDNSRFSLEKLVKQTRDQKKQQKIQNMLNTNSQSYNNNSIVLNSAKSQINSENQKFQLVSGYGRFISPTRKIVRKSSNSNRKLLSRPNTDRSQQKNIQQGLNPTKSKLISRSSQKQQVQRQKESEQQKKKQQIQERNRILSEKAAEQKKQIQKKKQEQQKKKAEEKRIQAKKRKQQQQQRAAEQRKLIEAKRKKEQEQLKRAQQVKKVEQRKLETQKRREQLRARKQQEQNEKKELIKQSLEEQERKKQLEQTKIRAQKEKEEEMKTQVRKQKLNKKQTFKTPVNNKEEGQEIHLLSTQKKVEPEFSQIKQKKKASIVVRVKSQINQVNESNYPLDLAPTISNSKWKQPPVLKATESDLFDSKGRKVIEQSKVILKNKKKQFDMKEAGLLIVFLIISTLLIVSAMVPSRKH